MNMSILPCLFRKPVNLFKRQFTSPVITSTSGLFSTPDYCLYCAGTTFMKCIECDGKGFIKKDNKEYKCDTCDRKGDLACIFCQ